MALAPELVEVSACPKCKGKLEFKQTEFVCLKCRLVYAVVEDIPNFIIDEAKPLV